jgi:(p)ppGpp synthase/HD superfamily hydrolase
MILERMGCEEAVVAAGLLHDTVEDTPVSIEEIERAFGARIAAIVAGCTELPKPQNSWEERKSDMIRRLRDAPLEVKLVAAADKYHNLSQTLAQERVEGPAVWSSFNRERGLQAWYYRAVLESIVANVEQPQRFPVLEWLAEVVAGLFDGVISRPPGGPPVTDGALPAR